MMKSSFNEEKVEVTKRNLYVIRWTVHGSEVDEWSDEIYDVETCGGEVEEAMSYITGDGRRDDDAMLLTDGICKDDGLFYKAFPTIEQAFRSLTKCHDERIDKMRHTIQSICGLDEEEYEELLNTEEIVEFANDDEGKFPPSANVMHSSSVVTFLDTSIGWGSTSYNDEGCNNDKQHKYIRCVSIVHSRVTCWIEELELSGREPISADIARGEGWLQELKI